MHLGTPEIISKSQRETNYAKYYIHASVSVIWNSFLNETATKKTYYRSISLNVKSKKRYLNFKNN